MCAVRVRRLLRVMFAALLLVAGVVVAPLPAAADRGDVLDVDITGISTPTIDLGDPDQVIDISGTVTNVSTVSVRYAAAHFWRSPRPLLSPEALAEQLADPPAGERLFEADENVEPGPHTRRHPSLSVQKGRAGRPSRQGRRP